ncbi:uncharacterized protein LOC135374226 [Ornithodoros turicata]|uniref:uncharacterized protein LOC135374226 n=1 Tax=Ornithodoros turicata TaxID=34597 RepID=UPI00313945AE
MIPPGCCGLRKHVRLLCSVINVLSKTLSRAGEGELKAVKPSLAAVAVKLPPFFDSNPSVWFLQAEAQFHLAGITSQLTKFYHVMSAFTPSAADEVYDVLANPSPTTPFDQLKQALLQRTTSCSCSRLQQLFSQEELRDRRPSQLLRRMRQLLGDNSASLDDTILRELFLQRLPQNVQMVLATAANMSLDQLATLADAVVKVASPTLSAVSSHQPPSEPAPLPSRSHPQATIDDLCREFRTLASLIAASHAPSTSRRDSSRRRQGRAHHSPRRSRSRSTTRDHSPSICWYHRRFGAEAHHCLLPCSWHQGNQPADN